MRTLVEGTDHGRGPQWVKLSDDDARRAHEMKCNGATFEEMRRHFRVRTAGSTWDIAWNALGLPNCDTSDETDCGGVARRVER